MNEAVSGTDKRRQEDQFSQSVPEKWAVGSPQPRGDEQGGAAVLSGVEHTGVIDLLEYDEEKGEVVLVMMERRLWDGSDLLLFQLQEKFNAYLSFALDGEMIEAYPHLEGRPLRLILRCASEPDPRSKQLLGLILKQIGFQGISLEVRVAAVPPEKRGEALRIGGGGCGSGCGCVGKA